MPVWAFVGLLYVGLWVLHRLWEGFSDLLPGGLRAWMGSLSRKDGSWHGLLAASCCLIVLTAAAA